MVVKTNVFGIARGLNRFQLKSAEFIRQEENGEFRFILGKYPGFLLSDIEDLKYLKSVLYRPWLKNNPQAIDAIKQRIQKNIAPNRNHGLYLFFNQNKELLYIGKSECDLCSRMFLSFEERQEQTNNEIKFVKLLLPKTVSDTNLLEQYLIKSYKPKLNIVFCEEDELTLKINGLKSLPQTDYIEINFSKFNSHLLNNHILEIYHSIREN